MKNVLIIGYGDIGRRVADLLQKKSEGRALKLTGVARSTAHAGCFPSDACQCIPADLDDIRSLGELPTGGASIFYFAPPPASGEADPRMANFLQAIRPEALPEKFVLLSTTAVYGDCGGEWITEDRPVDPQSERGKRRLDAERQMQTWCTEHQVPHVILRVGGIYGPGRWPLERLKKGLPILREAESPYTNRIHQDDLAQICIAAAERGESGEIYNVADGRPGTMSAYFKTVARHFRISEPPEVSLEQAQQVMTAGMLSYLQESRRIDNHKLLNGLGIKLQYPRLETGLAGERVV